MSGVERLLTLDGVGKPHKVILFTRHALGLSIAHEGCLLGFGSSTSLLDRCRHRFDGAVGSPMASPPASKAVEVTVVSRGTRAASGSSWSTSRGVVPPVLFVIEKLLG